MNAKRGFLPKDDRYFSPEALKVLQRASRHIFYLINEGYDLEQAATFVGNHFQLAERQRLAIIRSLATKEQLASREYKQIPMGALAGREVWIDGFNTIITAEVMLSDSLLLKGMDGCIRDLAALRGTYRMIPQTSQAINLILSMLQSAGVLRATFLLDEPVSNSGRLKTMIADHGESYSLDLDIRILKNVDRKLYDKENVITSDSVILDRCISWINLAEKYVEQSKASCLQVW
ncbi:MAG: DUF434 domain-containing protein [Coriobacteriales bacterium]|nr:DUF434 domain-containing protein [Coriobacteriales bacterium]